MVHLDSVFKVRVEVPGVVVVMVVDLAGMR